MTPRWVEANDGSNGMVRHNDILGSWEWLCAWGCADYGYPTGFTAEVAYMEHDCKARR